MKDIIEMAREVEATPYTNRHYPDKPTYTFTVEKLERFAALVRAEVLEEAAEVCDELRHPWGYSAETQDWCRGTDHCAKAIRALKAREA
jgi:hypothetical protein